MKTLARWAAVAVLVSGPAWACRFAPRPFADNAKDAQVAFVGKVTAFDSEKATATFAVEVVLKGTVGPSTTVVSSNTSCGLRFTEGQRWVVLSRDHAGTAWLSNLPDGSLELTDERGLQNPLAWEPVWPALTAAQHRALTADPCLGARSALNRFFGTLPVACTSEKDCVADRYIDTHPCYPPIVTNQQRVPQTSLAELTRLQKAERASCPIDSAKVPACEAMLRPVACVAGKCVGH